MARYEIPKNVGKVRVAMASGGAFAVWNGKHGRDEFRILVRTRKKADEIAGKINRKEHNGEIDVFA
jgi:hypothetical protein